MEDIQMVDVDQMDEPSSIPFIPDDVVHCILTTTFTSLETDLLDPSLSRGSSSPWCQSLRTKKAVSLVSRQWRACALPFLYSSVVIRRFPSLFALAEALYTKPRYGALVSRLVLNCYVALEEEGEKIGIYLHSILNHCPNIATLTIDNFHLISHFENLLSISMDSTEFGIATHNPPPRHLPKLQQLSLVTSPFMGPFPSHYLSKSTSILRINNQLVSLSLSMPDQGEFEAISLPALQELFIHPYPDGRADPMLSLTKWLLPSLTRLSWLYDGTNQWQQAGAFWRVVEAHGSHLKYLDIARIVYAQDFQRNVTSLCPQLEHLVLSADELQGWPTFDKAALHTDIWFRFRWDESPFEYEPFWTPEDFYPWLAGQYDLDLLSLPVAPVCGSVRFLSNGIASYSRIPQLLPPNRDSEDSAVSLATPRIHDFYGMRIVEWREGVMLEDEYLGHLPGCIGADLSTWYEYTDSEGYDSDDATSDSDWDFLDSDTP